MFHDGCKRPEINLELAPLFNPKSVALVGASSSLAKTGTTMLSCMLGGGFKGKIYLINPRESEILGLKTYSSVKRVPDEVDLAIICVPVAAMPQVIQECTEVGVKFGKKLHRESYRVEAEISQTPNRCWSI